MDQMQSRLLNFSSKRMLCAPRAYCNARHLLNSLKVKNKFTVESVLEALEQSVKKIDELKFENRILHGQMKKYQLRHSALVGTCTQVETSTNVKYLQQKVNNLQRVLQLHKSTTNDHIKLKTQCDKLRTIVKDLSGKHSDKTSHHRLMAGESTQIDADRERFKDLLNKMFGIERKIMEFKEQAATATQLKQEVAKLRCQLYKERAKANEEVHKLNEKYQEEIESLESQSEVSKKERDLYENISKNLEAQTKKILGERDMYEKKTQELKQKYEKLLFEMEEMQVMLQHVYKKEDQNHQCLPYYSYYPKSTDMQKNLIRSTLSNSNLKLPNENNTLTQIVTTDHDFQSKTHNEIWDRCWRKVSKNSNILLKIAPKWTLPYGFKRKFVLRTDRDLMDFRKTLAPSDAEVNEAVRRKNEMESLLKETKHEANLLINKIRKERLRQKVNAN